MFHSELIGKVEAKLRELLGSVLVVDSSSGAYGSHLHSGLGAVELVDVIRTCCEALVKQHASQLYSEALKLQEKNKELQEALRRAAAASSASSSTVASAVVLFDNMSTPAKKPARQSAPHTMELSNGMLTPIHSSHDEPVSTVTRSGRNKSLAEAMSASPSAKEAARLNAEVLREVSLSTFCLFHS